MTRKTEESAPCSDSMIVSIAQISGFAVASASSTDSDGPAGRPGSMRPASTRLAATNQGEPGPSILCARGTVWVPKAAAATATAPPALNTRSQPAMRAATRVAASTRPSGPGGVSR